MESSDLVAEPFIENVLPQPINVTEFVDLTAVSDCEESDPSTSPSNAALNLSKELPAENSPHTTSNRTESNWKRHVRSLPVSEQNSSSLSEAKPESFDESISIVFENVKPAPELLIVNEIVNNFVAQPYINDSLYYSSPPVLTEIMPRSTIQYHGAEVSNPSNSHIIPVVMGSHDRNEVYENVRMKKNLLEVENSDQKRNELKIECGICKEESDENLSSKKLMSTVCGHVFCEDCISTSLKHSRLCPKCRTKLTLKKIHPIYFDFKDN